MKNKLNGKIKVIGVTPILTDMLVPISNFELNQIRLAKERHTSISKVNLPVLYRTVNERVTKGFLGDCLQILFEKLIILPCYLNWS